MTEQLVDIGSDSTGNSRRISARELVQQLVGPGWIYPDQLKEKYAITDEKWKQVRRRLADEWRRVEQTRRKDDDHLLYQEIEEELSKYALALPHNVNRLTMMDIRGYLSAGQIEQLADYMVRLIMDPIYRARLIVKRYKKVTIFSEFSYLIESAYFAFLRDNFAASFMTILPVIEGFIQRWANWPGKLSFPQMWQFVEKTPERNPLLSLPLFADIWAKTCFIIMNDHLYKNTKEGSAYGDFNRHLALHLIQSDAFCTPHNIMRAFLLLDLLGDLYLAEHNQHDAIDTSSDEEVALVAGPYRSVIANREHNAEQAMVRYPPYRVLLSAFEKLGNPVDYWIPPLGPSLREIKQKVGSLLGRLGG